MKHINALSVLFVLVFLVASCTSEQTQPDGDSVSVEDPPPPPPPEPSGDTSPIEPVQVQDSLDSDPSLRQRRVFFGFDSSNVEDDFRELILSHSGFLQGNPNSTITLEGHTDERGTREYNLALGERRARAVRQLLIVQGVSPNQIRFISYGEESPVALSHEETSWAQNRRVEIVYANQ